MRIARAPDELSENLRVASEEARNSFGDGSMMVERLIERPRHIEVQVLADSLGNVACLFERECSIQRRHQKLIEEAPSPYIEKVPVRWRELQLAATKIVKAAGYTNAGTVEFIADPSSGEFYFLEVNARLQVEHPVTEAITGLDLVRLQLEIAEGKPLELPKPLSDGDRVAISGHAIEARIIAEDPGRSFLPSVGKIVAWAEPKMPGIRVDSGYREGDEVSPNYDSLVAKLIAHGPTREQAISKLKAALMDFHVLGIRTNTEYLLSILAEPHFKDGQIDTGFLSERMADWLPSEPSPLIGALGELATLATVSRNNDSEQFESAWGMRDSFRNTRVTV